MLDEGSNRWCIGYRHYKTWWIVHVDRRRDHPNILTPKGDIRNILALTKRPTIQWWFSNADKHNRTQYTSQRQPIRDDMLEGANFIFAPIHLPPPPFKILLLFFFKKLLGCSCKVTTRLSWAFGHCATMPHRLFSFSIGQIVMGLGYPQKWVMFLGWRFQQNDDRGYAKDSKKKYGQIL